MTWRGTKWLLGQCLKNARSLRLHGIRKMYWNSLPAAKQERIFSPQTGRGIFGSAADTVSLGGSFFFFFCAKCHQNWVNDYLQGMQLFPTYNIRAYRITRAPAVCARCPLASSFAFKILINMNLRGCSATITIHVSYWNNDHNSTFDNHHHIVNPNHVWKEWTLNPRFSHYLDVHI